MLKLPALLFAIAALPLHAAALTPRDAIFPATYQGRPAISSSGKWLAVEGLGASGIRLVPTTAAAAGVDVALPAGMRVHWYRWAHGGADTLTVGAGGASDAIYSYDVAAARLTRMTSDDMAPAFVIALPTNNFAFTYARFRNKTAGTFADLGPDGVFHTSAPATGEVPGYMVQQGRYFRMMPGPDGWTLSAGVAESTRFRLIVAPHDQRLGGGLVSISGDGKAYVLSSHSADTLGLVSMDLATGERKLLG